VKNGLTAGKPGARPCRRHISPGKSVPDGIVNKALPRCDNAGFILFPQRIINVSRLIAEGAHSVLRQAHRLYERDSFGMFRNLTKYLRRNISRFCVARRGTTAVEFALIAPAFIALLLAVIQTTIFLFAQQVLQNAAVESGRLFMTGSAQNGGLTQAQFLNDICPMVQAMFTCSKVMVNVQASSSAGGVSPSEPTLTYNTDGSVANSWNYTAGTQGQIMVVQLIYQWPIVGMPIGNVLSSLGNGTTEMMGVTAFRVEPY
jgi:Flp pilus assembly protein TadG